MHRRQPADRPPLPSSPRRIVLLVALVGVLTAAGCGTGTSSPRPSLPPLATGLRTPLPGATSRPPTQPPSTPGSPAGTPAWPAGWETAFCAAFEQVAIAQELAVDIGRALAEDARDDALALSRELQGTAPVATSQLEALPDWPPANDLIARLVSVMAVGERIGVRYERHIDGNSETALERVRELIADMRPLVVDALAELDELRAANPLACAGRDLSLESP